MENRGGTRHQSTKRRRTGEGLTACLLFVIGLAAAVIASRPGHSQPTAPSQLEIPRPDLGSMEAAARDKIESMQGALARLVGEPDVPKSDLAEGFGYLGQLFHAFQLHDAAEICYHNAQLLADDDRRWSYYLGLVRNARGDFEPAVGDYERALVLGPDDSATLLRLGNALLELNRHEDAQRRFARVLELDPASAAAHYGLGRVAAARGEHAAAAQSFEKALALQPEATVVHYPLAQAYRKLGDVDRARLHLGKRGEERPRFEDPLGDQVSRLAKGTAFEVALALARDTERFSARDFLGFALSQFGDVKGAIEQLEHGLALHREAGEEETSALERARIHYLLGGLLVNDLRDEEAIRQFSAAVELDPTLLDARLKWGNCLARGRRFTEAAESYSRVLAVDPTHAAALLNRAAALMEAGRDAEARVDLERLVELHPSETEAHARLALVLARSGEVDAAIDRYRTAAGLDLAPTERVSVHLQLARLLRQRGQLEDALDQFRLALEADPASLPALDGRASLLGQMGRYAEAAGVYGVLVALRPDSPVARVGEATALILGGQYAAATARLEEGLVALPDQLTLKDILARHLAACPDLSVRDGARSLELARELWQQLPTPESMETLAMALAEAGRFEEAEHWQSKLLERVEADGGDQDPARLRANLERYRRGEACCVE
ncbi:MAG TPA: tetratricopeptide repeat protein [Thermoanaerobaculia bacterium]|nr:tetratricopeptide repeat protein [Thermoanaerobaculia bacterium]